LRHGGSHWRYEMGLKKCWGLSYVRTTAGWTFVCFWLEAESQGISVSQHVGSINLDYAWSTMSGLIIRDFSFFEFHPLPSRSFRIQMVSVSPLKSWRQREREFSCSKSQTLNQTLSRGTFSVIIHFYSNLFPYGSTFQLFDPNFRDVSVGWVCCQMFVAMCSIPLRCSWAEAVAQQLSCGVMWRCKMRVFGPGPCRFGVCKCHVQ
jgi:hypothetical protein